MTNKQFRKELKESIIKVKKMGYAENMSVDGVRIDKYFTGYDYVEVKGLYDFVTRFAEVSSEELEELVINNAKDFTLLGKFIKLNKGIVDEMREHGLTYACLACRNSNVLEYNCKVVEQREQALGR